MRSHWPQETIDGVPAASESFLVPVVFLIDVLNEGVDLIHSEHHSSLLPCMFHHKFNQMLAVMIMLEPVNELPGKFMPLLSILNLVAYRAIDFQNEGYHNIEHYKRANDPKGREVEAGPVRPSDDTVHIGRLVPVIDDQDVEQGHHAGVKVVKVDQEVHI